jgi:TRAP transporter TAXI family solute receptor
MERSRDPRLDLTMVGCWGTANFHAILGWLAAHLRWRSAPLSRFVVRTGSAYREGVELVGTGNADLAITTPCHLGVRWAFEGKHFYGGRAFTNLRTLGKLPQDDRLTFAVRADTGIRSFADVRAKRPKLRIATPARDQDNLCSYAIDRILQAHDIDPDDIVRWGGAFVEHESPRVCLSRAIAGEVDAVFNEAIMLPGWREWQRSTPVNFIPITPEAMQRLVSGYGFRPATIESGRLDNAEPIPCLDWSNWVTVVRDDMPESVAYRITAVMVEERAEFEARYRHIPVHNSPLTYPIEPARMPRDIGIPLHPGAERYYREHGYLTDDGQ